MKVEIPDVICSFIETQGKEVSEVLVNSFLNTLGREERVKLYLALSEEYLSKAKDGETCWKALSYIFKAFAELEGMEISSYQDYYNLAEYLSFKENNPELVKYFLNAEKLHAEFHPRPQDGEATKVRMEYCKKLVEIVKSKLQQQLKAP